MPKFRVLLLTILAALAAIVDVAPVRAQLLPLPISIRSKPKRTVTPTPPATPTPTMTRTATPASTATRTATRTPTPAATTGSRRPDMVPEISDVHLQLATSVAAGDVAEGCAESTTGVDLLRFTAASKNVGNADLVLGDPRCPSPCEQHPLEVCGNPDFVCSPAAGHNHAHYDNYARYELLDAGGTAIVVGHKQGFCLRDTNCAAPVYTCANQGISAGCYDLYYYTLGCQYLDVTDIPAGNYVLRVRLDPLNQIAELSESNNVAVQTVTITRPGATPTRTPTAVRTATPVPTLTRTLTPPPTATRTATALPTPTRTATVVATTTRTATPLPGATRTRTPSPIASSTPTITRTAAPTSAPTSTPPAPVATPTGTPGAPNGSVASACQRAILKAGRTLIARTIVGLDDCAAAVSSCEPPRRRTAGCRERAAASCAQGTARIAHARAAFVEGVAARCAAAGEAELFTAAGLAYARRAEACAGEFGVGLDDVTSVALCLSRQHVCRAGLLYEAEEPRTGARLRQGGGASPEICIADLGGGPELEESREIEACSRTLRRAGRRFSTHRLMHLESCLAAQASCLKATLGREACEVRAAESCATRRARLALATARLRTAIDRSCAEIDFGILRAETGANLAALAPTCVAFGVAELRSLADYQQCLARQHACAVDDLLRFQAPHAAEWIGEWPLPGGACPGAPD